MADLAYPVDHPAHPDNAGKKFSTPPTPFSHDYMPDHPARGGQGQSVPLQAVAEGPRDGFKHLHGLAASTLQEAEKLFAALPGKEREARLEWNKKGIPVAPEEE
jgi:hypothetical protein